MCASIITSLFSLLKYYFILSHHVSYEYGQQRFWMKKQDAINRHGHKVAKGFVGPEPECI